MCAIKKPLVCSRIKGDDVIAFARVPGVSAKNGVAKLREYEVVCVNVVVELVGGERADDTRPVDFARHNNGKGTG